MERIKPVHRADGANIKVLVNGEPVLWSKVHLIVDEKDKPVGLVVKRQTGSKKKRGVGVAER